jgi:hypothetical protein
MLVDPGCNWPPLDSFVSLAVVHPALKSGSIDPMTINPKMTAEAATLTNVLLAHQRQIHPNPQVASSDIDNGTITKSTIPYGKLCASAGVPFLTRSVGDFLIETAHWCESNNFPPVHALAVNSETGMPGDSYDGAPGGCSLLGWPTQVRECIAFDGYPDSI